MHDVLTNVPDTTIKCLDHGFVTLVDCMPRLVPEDRKTADGAIVQAARVSYGVGTKTVNEDRGLIRYLMRHAHTTPLEMVEFKFHCKMPIFVARQWIRHRTANVNEVSGRYSVLKDEFYFPEKEHVRFQSKKNKQGGEEQADSNTTESFKKYLQDLCHGTYSAYEDFIEDGVAREQSRMVLPLNIYTEWYWKCDLHNIFHFLGLRCDSHAQYEIRVFAEAMRALITPIVPLAIESWDDYHTHRGAVKLTKLEIESLRQSLEGKEVQMIESKNKRECGEWEEKAKLLGLTVSNEASNQAD